MKTPLVACSLAAALVATLLSVPTPAQANSDFHSIIAGRTDLTPTVAGRAKLSADYLAEGPASGAKAASDNGRQGPWPGQVIPGFSAIVETKPGTFLAMPDNGFGTKQNSADFLLRIYRVTPAWSQDATTTGRINIDGFIQLRDPQHKIDFEITNQNTKDRFLTGADFDIESLVQAKDGSLWIGEEFGPFLLHFSADGILVDAPVKFPHGMSASNPYLQPNQPATVRSSKGFEAMAASTDGRYLYPMLEGYLPADQDKRRRMIYEFDTEHNTYTGKTWQYKADGDDVLLGDAFTVRNGQILVLERDDFWGPKSVTKRIYKINLSVQEADGFLAKELVLDALKIANPRQIDTVSDRNAYRVSNPFSFPVQSLETVLITFDGKMLLANDNNYPSNDARFPGKPDDTEMIIIDAMPNIWARPHQHRTTVIGHRGASGYRPEHTMASYELAIQQCADFIEPDLVSTKDGVLVSRHEPEIGGTTDVAQHPEFASRKTTKQLDGVPTTGWFSEDFTLAELKTLRAVERLPEIRQANTAFDRLYQIPTFAEVVDLARHSRSCSGKPIGIIPEIKHSTYFKTAGLPMEAKTVAELHRGGFNSRKSPAVIQSFEINNLKELRTMTDVSLVQLLDCEGAPYDQIVAGSKLTYQEMVSADQMRTIASYADQVGMCKGLMIPRNADNSLAQPTAAIKNAHEAKLKVVGWTFRAENNWLPQQFQSSAKPTDKGNLVGEIKTFLAAGMDDYFTDQPDLGDQAAIIG